MGASLLGRRFRADGEDIFIADVAVRQTHFLGGEVTRHPIESGGEISDHVVCAPERLTLEMEISNNPLCGTEIGNQGFAETQNRINSAFEQLKRIRCEKRAFDVQTKLCLYRNMVIESIDASQDADSCNVLRFAANLVKVNIVGSETTTLERANENLQGPVNRGDVATPTQPFCEIFIINPIAFEAGGVCECEDISDFEEREECLRGALIRDAIAVLP